MRHGPAGHSGRLDSRTPADDDDDEDEEDAKGSGQKMLDDRPFRSSTKLDALIDSLQAAKAKDANLKAVVFSQFTAFLDMIERIMSSENIK